MKTLSAMCGLLWMILLGATSYGETPRARAYAGAENLRSYALSTCFSYVSTSTEIGKDAAASSAAYVERGQAPLEAYSEIASLSKSFLARTYVGEAAVRFNTMKCIDFYHSAELDRLIKKYSAPPKAAIQSKRP